MTLHMRGAGRLSVPAFVEGMGGFTSSKGVHEGNVGTHDSLDVSAAYVMPYPSNPP